MLAHDALLYRGIDEFTAGTATFMLAGVEAGELVAASVPTPHLDVLRDALGPAAERVRLADMTEVGRNPARIIPTLRDWFGESPARRVRFVGEPIWPGRSAVEAVEGMRHEALLNVAFADLPGTILCPYDVEGLDPRVVAEAEHTHPTMIEDGERRASHHYRAPRDVYAALERPLAPAPADADELAVTLNLRRLRGTVRAHAARVALEARRTHNLLVAVSEAASNTVRHGGGDGVLRIWEDGDELICEISDSGRIDDLLAGRRRPSLFEPSGRGLWLINQLCDLVELRTDDAGTTLRLHMRTSGAAVSGAAPRPAQVAL